MIGILKAVLRASNHPKRFCVACIQLYAEMSADFLAPRPQKRIGLELGSNVGWDGRDTGHQWTMRASCRSGLGLSV